MLSRYRELRKKFQRLLQKGPKLKFYYAWFYKHCKVNPKRMLFESFHGKNISDSSLAVLQEMVKRGIASDYEIYYASKDIKHDQQFVDSNHLPVKLIDITTRKYTYILATAKYLLNNSSFPVYFIRRPEQIYVQTWHGTPLKTLGKQMRLGIESMYNVQHNFIQANMLTFPNAYTRTAIMRDYNLEDLYTGKIAMVGYPRNSVFMQGDNPDIRKRYSLDVYETFAYMPTWRGKSNHSVDVEGYTQQVKRLLSAIDDTLNDRQKMFVNFHSMVAESISLGAYKHIEPFPSDVGNYDFLAQIDVLVTDYSSVFIDYALTRKPIVLFAYDFEEYTHDRGFYMPITDLPFPILYTLEDMCDYIRERKYLEPQPDRSAFDADFLAYDSANNSGDVLDLLLEKEVPGIPIDDYARNKQRTWRIFDAPEQSFEEYIDGIFRSADPERDIVLLNRTGFGERRSVYLHDHFRDYCNFMFVTKTTPRTFIEDVTKRFSKRAKRRLQERERVRLFGDLPTEKKRKTLYCSGEVGSGYSSNAEVGLPVEVSEEGTTVTLQFEGEGYIAERALLVMRGRCIVWAQDLEGADCTALRARFDLREIMLDESFQVVDSSFAKPALYARRVDTGEHRVLVGSCGDLPVYKDDFTNRAFSPILLSTADLQEHLPKDASGATGKKIVDRANGRDISVVPYFSEMKAKEYFAFNKLCFMFYYAGGAARVYRRPYSTRVSTPGQKLIHVKVSMRKGDFEIRDVALLNRRATSDTRYSFDYTTRESGDHILIDAKLDPKGLVFDGVYWDFCISIIEANGDAYDVPVLSHSGFNKSMLFLNRQCDLGNGNIIFPYTAKDGKLSFTHREKHYSDTAMTKVREVAAFAIFTIGHAYWARQRMWLVYEKFCSLAQDNGYYFFEYCMEHASPDVKKHIFYVIDKNSTDYDKVKKYGRNVVQFMSFRHMLYIMVAKIYIGSDAKTHLYQWRPKPSIVRRRLSRHKVFFLQHGVTAMKRVDYLFGLRGSSPMTYFLTTSKAEQEIVVREFGYSEETAPVLGFSRWDALVDTSDSRHRTILVMPTWRQWLEEIDDDIFVASEYFQVYSNLLAESRLESILEKHNATVKFFIHPKLSQHLKNFNLVGKHVELINMGSTPLNELIMECSMLITDYSSVAWDVLYMKKPVLYFQFDQERYLDEVGSYIDFNTQLPGPVSKDKDALLDQLEERLAMDCAIMEDEMEIRGKWFDFEDRDNRARTYSRIVDLGF